MRSRTFMDEVPELTDYDVSRIKSYRGGSIAIRNAFLLVCCTGIGYLDLREVTIGSIVGDELHIHPSLHSGVKVVHLTDEAKSYLHYTPLVSISLPKLNAEIGRMMHRLGLYGKDITLYSARRYYRLHHDRFARKPTNSFVGGIAISLCLIDRYFVYLCCKQV